jgi:hypothetical protein
MQKGPHILPDVWPFLFQFSGSGLNALLLHQTLLCAILLRRTANRTGTVALALMLMQVFVLPFLLAHFGPRIACTRLAAFTRTGLITVHLARTHRAAAILHTATLATAFTATTLGHRHTTTQRSNQNRNHQNVLMHISLP